MTIAELLDAIEGALNDDAVSDDAVRWTPQQIEARRRVLAREHLRRQHGITVPPLLTPEQVEEANRRIGEHFAALIEALRPAVEQAARMGQALGKLGQSQAALRETILRTAVEQHRRDAGLPTSIPPPPPPELRATDPRAYALQARRCRGTGPDRQMQHRPPPRKIL